MSEPPSDIRRTKIVCTIGPATRSLEMMCELITAGADVFRFNFSHGTEADHAENVDDGASGGQAVRQGDRDPGRPARAEAAARRRRGRRRHSWMWVTEVTITTEDVVG